MWPLCLKIQDYIALKMWFSPYTPFPKSSCLRTPCIWTTTTKTPAFFGVQDFPICLQLSRFLSNGFSFFASGYFPSLLSWITVVFLVPEAKISSFCQKSSLGLWNRSSIKAQLDTRAATGMEGNSPWPGAASHGGECDGLTGASTSRCIPEKPYCGALAA